MNATFTDHAFALQKAMEAHPDIRKDGIPAVLQWYSGVGTILDSMCAICRREKEATKKRLEGDRGHGNEHKSVSAELAAR